MPWLAAPASKASLRPRAEQDSRTPPTPAAIAACFTDLVLTRRIALHEPRTAIVPPSTGLLLEQVHERWIEAPQQATVRGGYASLLLSYSLLSHCCGSGYCCCRCCCCHPCSCGCLLFPSSVEYVYFMLALYLPDGCVLSLLPSKLVLRHVSYTSSPCTLMLHAQQEGQQRMFIFSPSKLLCFYAGELSPVLRKSNFHY